MTVPPPLLTDLHHTADPHRRAARFNALADADDLAGWPARARLLRLVADTESLLFNADHECAEDPAWDNDGWWTLANTRDRQKRADLLADLWRDWAYGEFGDDADILLRIAETERAVADHDLDTILAQTSAELLGDLNAGFDYEADLADVYARAAETETSADAPADTAEQGSATPAARRPAWVNGRNAARLGMLATAILSVVALALVAAPATPDPMRLGAAAGLIAAVVVWVLWNVFGRRP